METRSGEKREPGKIFPHSCSSNLKYSSLEIPAVLRFEVILDDRKRNSIVGRDDNRTRKPRFGIGTMTSFLPGKFKTCGPPVCESISWDIAKYNRLKHIKLNQPFAYF